MNGEIDFKSEKDQGSTFWVTLPVAEHDITNSSEEIENIQSSIVGNGTTNTILYIEDNDWNAKLLTDVLSVLSNVEMHVAPSGEMGRDLANKINPDLIILDIHLPDTTGFKLLDEFRQMDKFSHTSIIALTLMQQRTQENVVMWLCLTRG